MNDTTQNAFRTLVKLAAGGLITKGLTNDAGLEIAAGALVALGAFIWGLFHQKKLKEEEPPLR